MTVCCSAVILIVNEDATIYLVPEQRWEERALFEKNRLVGVIYRSFRRMKDKIRLDADNRLYV